MKAVRPHASLLLAAALVTIVSWPVTGDMYPRHDLDGAWEIAIRQGLHDGLQFGRDIIFTYGPLGFLREPLLVYPWPARLAYAYGLLIHFTLCATLIWALRRALGSLVVAAVVAVLLAATMWQEPTIPIGFGAAVALAAGFARGRWRLAVAAGLGTLGGIELLSKVNAGITLTALGVVAVLVAPVPRRAIAATFAAGLAAALVIGWVATGQSAATIDDYVKASLAVASGYSQAMYMEDPRAAWEFWAAFLVIGIGYVMAWRAADLLPWKRSRVGMVALWTVLAFTSFKSGFVRHDPGHANIFFASLLGGIVMLGWVPHRRLTGWLVGLLLLVTLYGSLREDPANYVQPITRASKLFDQAKLLTDGSATNRAIAAARLDRIPLAQLNQRLHDAAEDGTVHIEPADAGVVWSQRLRWKPLPVFQSYTAYTRSLDERNAAVVRSPGGPKYILRESNNTIDQRNPAWESPEAQREMLCHFRATMQIGRWVLLQRSAPRCGTPRLLASEAARIGEPARVPPAPDAGSVVFVRIDGIAVSGLEMLRTAIYRSLPRNVVLSTGVNKQLMPGTAEDGLVMRVPRGADFPAQFALDQRADTMTVTRGADRGQPLTLRFYAMPIQ